MRILIVEDDKSLNEALYKLLTSEHYGVDRCYDGLDAKHHISVTPYDAVVLLDDTGGKYVNFKLEFPDKKGRKK